MVTKVACYVRGTNIRTSKGDVPVEDLRVGDRLITHSGRQVDVRWLGWRTIEVKAGQADLKSVQPICIKADAMATGVPDQDLLVSPEHAMLIDGKLIAAFLLENNATVTRGSLGVVTYYHIECDQHEILVANGAPAESYLENADRSFFANCGSATALHPKMPESAAVSPFTQVDIDDVVRIRDALRDRAVSLGYTDVADPDVRSRLRSRRAA